MDYVIAFVTAAIVGCFMLIIERCLANTIERAEWHDGSGHGAIG
jgi:hypothetical protein